MIATLLVALFAASAILAAGSIVASARRYGAAVFALREQLRACSTSHEVNWSIAEIHVRPACATLFRRGQRRNAAARRAVSRPALRAAA